MALEIKRVYEKPAASDGKRVLVDRLWPRGVSKASAKIYVWMKEVSPSSELREWFSHDPKRWQEFKRRYRKELKENAAFTELEKLAKRSKITLVYGAKDTEHNNAAALAWFIGHPSTP